MNNNILFISFLEPFILIIPVVSLKLRDISIITIIIIIIIIFIIIIIIIIIIIFICQVKLKIDYIEKMSS